MRISMLSLALCSLVGCTHQQLRYNTISQAQTVSDVHQTQVLNNLAKFIENPDALPDFAWPKSGLADVTDSGSLGFAVNWVRAGFSASGLDGAASRTAKENWTLTPINDPRKLELMRCAYQKALESCGQGSVSINCPNCRKRWNKFYRGREYSTEYDVKSHLRKPVLDESGARVANIVHKPNSHDGNGVVNSECLGSCCWYGYGCKKCVPTSCAPQDVGRYGNTYVWVLPGGHDELTKLTLAILDYATNEPPQTRSKKVELFLNEKGKLINVKKDDAYAQKVTVNVPAGTRSEELEYLLGIREIPKEKAAEVREGILELNALPQRRSIPPRATEQELQQLLDVIQ